MNNLEYTTGLKRTDLMRKHFPEGVTPEMNALLDEVEELLVKSFWAGYKQAQEDSPQAWNNHSAFGYTISAAQRAGMKNDSIVRLLGSMHRAFDELTLEEAAVHYRQSKF